MDYVLDYGFLRFRLQLHVATLQLDIFVYNCLWQHCSGTTFRTMASSFTVYKCMWPRGSSQWNVQVLEETFQRVTLESRLRGPLMDLENHLMKSISDILLNPSGKVVRISELTFLADSGILALALVTAYVSATVRYPANFSRVIQNVPY